jgi:hypothetical protein
LTVDQATIAEFVAQQSLNTYTPHYYQTSPLTDPILFNAFRHFIERVAPTMSLIESYNPTRSYHTKYESVQFVHLSNANNGSQWKLGNHGSYPRNQLSSYQPHLPIVEATGISPLPIGVEEITN